jgi:hypothetical protein
MPSVIVNDTEILYEIRPQVSMTGSMLVINISNQFNIYLQKMEPYPDKVFLYHSENMSTITKMNYDEMKQFVKEIVEELLESDPRVQDFFNSDLM